MSMGFRRSLVPVAWILIVVILAICPRTVMGPTRTFDRATESKRPKTPRNVVRAEPTHTANVDRQTKFVRPDPAVANASQSHDLQVRTTLAPRVPSRAFHELTKPDYLKLVQGSPPTNRLAPPV
jgi:hypothetical protein